MEVKSVYLDLKEGPQYAKKNKDVRILKSEAFKDPLKLKLEYSLTDIQKLEEYEKSCWEAYNEIGIVKEKLEVRIQELEDQIKKVDKLNKQIEELSDKYDRNYNTLKNNETLITNGQKVNISNIETLKSGIINLGDKIDQIRSFNPYSYYKKLFISSNEYYLSIDLPSGNYLVIDKREITGLNENTISEENIDFYQINVQDNYNLQVLIQSKNQIDGIAADCVFNILFFKL